MIQMFRGDAMIEEITSYKAAEIVDGISMKIDGSIAILELSAERDTTEMSIILYAVVDMLNDRKNELDKLTVQLMHTYRTQMGIK